MAALTKERNTAKRYGRVFSDPVKGATKIYAGALVALDANGYLVPGAVSTTLVARGRARATIDNTAGADGAVNGESEAGVFHYENDGSITRADIGKVAYIVDDQTVADNDGGATRSAAGEIVDVDSTGVFIDVKGF